MSVKFNVKMTEEYMFHFLLYHNYSRFSGILGVILGIGSLGLAVNSLLNSDTQTAAIGLLVAIMFLFVTPHTMKSRAKMQVQNSQMFQKPLEYELTEAGVVVRQDELEVSNSWDEFSKAVSTKKVVILYITSVRALIFPKECMGEQYQAAVDMIRAHMPASKVKIK